jgi:hypothetical protein
MTDFDIDTLALPQDELETLTRFHISTSLINLAFRPSCLRSLRGWIDLVITEGMIAILSAIFCAPIAMLIARNFGTSGRGSEAIVLVQIGGLATLVAFGLVNLLLWGRSRQYQVLDRILEDVARYNDVIQAIKIFQELQSAQPTDAQLNEQNQVIQALTVTRESLLCAIMTDRILRKNQRFLARRQELFNNIEQNLVTLQALQVQNPADDYGQFLNEAIDIALSVRQEMEAIQAHDCRR